MEKEQVRGEWQDADASWAMQARAGTPSGGEDTTAFCTLAPGRGPRLEAADSTGASGSYGELQPKLSFVVQHNRWHCGPRCSEFQLPEGSPHALLPFPRLQTEAQAERPAAEVCFI